MSNYQINSEVSTRPATTCTTTSNSDVEMQTQEFSNTEPTIEEFFDEYDQESKHMRENFEKAWNESLKHIKTIGDHLVYVSAYTDPSTWPDRTDPNELLSCLCQQGFLIFVHHGADGLKDFADWLTDGSMDWWQLYAIKDLARKTDLSRRSLSEEDEKYLRMYFPNFVDELKHHTIGVKGLMHLEAALKIRKQDMKRGLTQIVNDIVNDREPPYWTDGCGLTLQVAQRNLYEQRFF